MSARDTVATSTTQAAEPPPSQPQIIRYPDIGYRAKWSVSSYKFGFGAECLRDGDPETFWHSDGPQPHFVTIEFPKKMAIQKVSIYLNFTADDSYTPATIAIRAGTGPSDLQDVRVTTMEKPEGWQDFDLVNSDLNEDGDGYKPLHAYIIQVIIIANHMSGKDTHVRGLRILGPPEEQVHEGDPFPWKTREFAMWNSWR